MTDNNQALTIFEPANVQAIAGLAPQAYQENSLSHTRCLEAGRQLLARVTQEGMTDTLDMDVAKYIEKAKLTVKKMNGKRSSVTQLFDQIRRVYTSLENDVDPAKTGTIPYELQQHRNAYARAKHEAEERRRREEAARLAKENAKTRYRADVEDDYVRQFNVLVNTSINALTDMYKAVTLDNYKAVYGDLSNFDCELPKDWCQSAPSGAHRPAEFSADECRAIQASVMAGLANRFKEQYAFEVAGTRDDLRDRMPSKKAELERIAKASAEEAAKIKADMEAKEQAEASRVDAERLEREKQQEASARLAASKQEMDSLFGVPMATPAAYQPKTQVKKKIVIASADDIMSIVGFWWSQEGCNKSVEELSKEFKKQINYANAAANSKDNPMFIANVRYEDEVKAK